MEKMRWKLLRNKFVRLFMLFFLVLGVSFFMYGGCGSSDGEVCFFVDPLDLGIADNGAQCDLIAQDFDCFDGIFDPDTFDCVGDNCTVCEDGTCNLAFETNPIEAECDALQDQFDCDESILVGIDCSLGDCNLCPP